MGYNGEWPIPKETAECNDIYAFVERLEADIVTLQLTTKTVRQKVKFIRDQRVKELERKEKESCM